MLSECKIHENIILQAQHLDIWREKVICLQKYRNMSSALDVLEGLEDDSEEEAEAMTAADVLQKLEEVNKWLHCLELKK